MLNWAKQSITDKRVKPVGTKKVVRTFRLSPEILKKLEEAAKQRASSLTKTLEEMIANHS